MIYLLINKVGECTRNCERSSEIILRMIYNDTN